MQMYKEYTERSKAKTRHAFGDEMKGKTPHWNEAKLRIELVTVKMYTIPAAAPC